MYKLLRGAREASAVCRASTTKRCVDDFADASGPFAPAGLLNAAPAALRLPPTAQFHASTPLDAIRAGRHFSVRNAVRKKKLTYEMSQEPQYVGVTKSWNTINAGNFFVHDRPMDKCNIAVEDMFIRKFMHGTWHRMFASEVIIKRKANLITLSGFITRKVMPSKVYFLQGYTEELLSRILKCPVKIDIQTTDSLDDLVFKEI